MLYTLKELFVSEYFKHTQEVKEGAQFNNHQHFALFKILPTLYAVVGVF